MELEGRMELDDGTTVSQYHNQDDHTMCVVVSREVDGHREVMVAPDVWQKPMSEELAFSSLMRVPCALWNIIVTSAEVAMLRSISETLSLGAHDLLAQAGASRHAEGHS